MEIRGLLRGKAFAKFPEAFLNGLRAGIINGITRTVSVHEGLKRELPA